MKKILTMFIVSLMAISLVGCGSDSDKIKVGVIQLAKHPALDKAYKGFKKGLEAEMGKDKVSIDYQNASGDQANCVTIADKLVTDGNKLIYAIATPAAQAVKQRTADIPIVLSAVTDPKSAGLVKSNEKPGVNVTGTSDLTPIKDQMELLKQLLPNAKKIAIMYCSAEDNSKFQANIAKEEAEKVGLEWMEATVADSNEIQQITESLIGKVDAIYIPTDNLVSEGMATVSQVANENNLPCIVGESAMLYNGGLATYGIDYYNLGLKAGKQAAKILKGDAKPENMAIEYLPKEDCELAINTTVAKKLGIEIPADLLKKAKQIK